MDVRQIQGAHSQTPRPASPTPEIVLWDQPEDWGLGATLSLEEQVLNSTFEACDSEKKGVVAVGQVLAYLEAVTGRSPQDSDLCSLAQALDPSGEGPTAIVNRATFFSIMQDWIATCQLGPGLELEEEAAVEPSLQPSGIPAQLESYGDEEPGPELPATAELLSNLEELELSNRRLAGENAKLQRSVETADEGAARLGEELASLRKQLRSSQQALQFAKAVDEELEDMKSLAKSLEEKNRSLVAQARQTEREQQQLVAEVETLQEEVGLGGERGLWAGAQGAAGASRGRAALNILRLHAGQAVTQQPGRAGLALPFTGQPEVADEGNSAGVGPGPGLSWAPPVLGATAYSRLFLLFPRTEAAGRGEGEEEERGAVVGEGGLRVRPRGPPGPPPLLSSRSSSGMNRWTGPSPPLQRQLCEYESLICHRDHVLSERTNRTENLTEALEEYRATIQVGARPWAALRFPRDISDGGLGDPGGGGALEGPHELVGGWMKLHPQSLCLEIEAIRQRQELGASLLNPLCGSQPWGEPLEGPGGTGAPTEEPNTSSEKPHESHSSWKEENSWSLKERDGQRADETGTKPQDTAGHPTTLWGPRPDDRTRPDAGSSPKEPAVHQASEPVMSQLVSAERRTGWGQIYPLPLAAPRHRTPTFSGAQPPILGLLFLLLLLSFLVLVSSRPLAWPQLQLHYLQTPPV
ncbi:protein KASH5 [Sarcophilus harrisii]|uniref:protein KASH5 n=1 Tax=Sarcophilus harrisii TaxID=9305 RepID=UPI001301F712|nr:protein KASH5 [Sarcophilus harrisii]